MLQGNPATLRESRGIVHYSDGTRVLVSLNHSIKWGYQDNNSYVLNCAAFNYAEAGFE